MELVAFWSLSGRFNSFSFRFVHIPEDSCSSPRFFLHRYCKSLKVWQKNRFPWKTGGRRNSTTEQTGGSEGGLSPKLAASAEKTVFLRELTTFLRELRTILRLLRTFWGGDRGSGRGARGQ